MIRICPVCKIEFKTPPSQNYKTCSMKCRNKSDWLGKVRRVMKNVNRKDNNNSRWMGGRSRGYILKKAKESWWKKKLPYKCEKCGVLKGWMIYHHIDGDDKNSINKNILLVCGSCHNKIHGKGVGKQKCKKCGKFLGRAKHYC